MKIEGEWHQRIEPSTNRSDIPSMLEWKCKWYRLCGETEYDNWVVLIHDWSDLSLEHGFKCQFVRCSVDVSEPDCFGHIVLKYTYFRKNQKNTCFLYSYLNIHFVMLCLCRTKKICVCFLQKTIINKKRRPSRARHNSQLAFLHLAHTHTHTRLLIYRNARQVQHTHREHHRHIQRRFTYCRSPRVCHSTINISETPSLIIHSGFFLCVCGLDGYTHVKTGASRELIVLNAFKS